MSEGNNNSSEGQPGHPASLALHTHWLPLNRKSAQIFCYDQERGGGDPCWTCATFTGFWRNIIMCLTDWLISCPELFELKGSRAEEPENWLLIPIAVCLQVRISVSPPRSPSLLPSWPGLLLQTLLTAEVPGYLPVSLHCMLTQAVPVYLLALGAVPWKMAADWEPTIWLFWRAQIPNKDLSLIYPVP